MRFPEKFICRDVVSNTIEHHVNAPYLRKNFSAALPAEKAEIIICGLGFYRLFINGEEITKGMLAPYMSNPDDVLYYDCYNIADYLKDGENVIGIQLGNGILNSDGGRIWDFDLATFRSAPKVAFSIELCDSMGSRTIDADSSVKTAPSPCTYDDLRCGCFYDAREEIPGWCAPGFDDSGWDNAIVAKTPKGIKRICEAEPINVFKENDPANVYAGTLASGYSARSDLRVGTPQETPPEKNGLIFDFGTNSAGVFRMKISGADKGTKISFQAAELLNDNGEVYHHNTLFYPDGYAQRDIYICRGGEEEFIPFFTYHGFRYLFVSGLPKGAEKNIRLTRLECCSDVAVCGRFKCSDEILNKIDELAVRSDRSNFYYFPTDCPGREKNGWTGDAAISTAQFLYHFNAENSFREWLRNICAAQTPIGSLPGVIPTGGWGFAWGNGPAWDRVLLIMTECIYDFTGDPAVIYENADSIERYIHYLATKKNHRGLYGFGLGDWLQPSHGAGNPDTPIEVTDSAVAYTIYSSACRILKIAKRNSAADFANQMAEDICNSIHQNLLDESGSIALCPTQTAQAIFLNFGIIKDKSRKAAAEELVARIHQNDDKINTGVVGTHILFFTLSDAGYPDLAYKMITGPAPSYGNIVRSGLTTLPESLDYYNRAVGGIVEDSGVYSFNHHFLGSITAWFFGGICGIRFTDGKANITPCFPESLDFAEAECRGVRCSWRRDGETIILSADCDHENEGMIKLPGGYCFENSDLELTFKPGQYVIHKKS